MPCAADKRRKGRDRIARECGFRAGRYWAKALAAGRIGFADRYHQWQRLAVAAENGRRGCADGAGGTDVRRSNFDAKGTSDDEAAKLIEGVYKSGFENIKKVFQAM